MTEPNPQELQARAQAALKEGNTSLAFECFQECLRLAPANNQARYGAALSAARLGSISEAEGLLEPILTSTTIESELHVDCLSLRGRLQKDRYERELDPRRQRAAGHHRRRRCACHRAQARDFATSRGTGAVSREGRRAGNRCRGDRSSR